MLEEIRVAGIATYPDDTQSLARLRAVNFLFGTNGSGKTTLSRIVSDPSAFPKSSIVWRNGRAVETLVYNSDFVERNLTPQLRGIFTLGEAEAETHHKIEEGRKAVDDLIAEIVNLQNTLGADHAAGKRLEVKTLRARFEEACWKIKIDHDNHFQGAFEGLRNSKSRFCDRVIQEHGANEAALHGISDLKARAATVYATNVAQLPLLAPFDAQPLLAAESATVLAKKVVGKEDVDVSALVRRLGNSDWVRQGLKFATAGAPCPFCQKEMEADLLAKLNAFFDEAYIADVTEIEGLLDSYSVHTTAVLERAEASLASGSPHIDIEIFRPLVDRLRTILALNKTKLERKRAEPSAPIELEPLAEAADAVLQAVATANDEIVRHNAIVADLHNERTRLSAAIWKYLIEDQNEVIAAYNAEMGKLDKAVAGLTAAIQAKNNALATKRAALAELERKVTSVQPTITEINSTLASFGFTSFKLRAAGDKGQAYGIVRGDGTDARDTLSEGERSFISFLYFYHLIRGSTSASGVTNDRIVVFDDPVSSLDSDVLFIVSALIRRTLAEAINGNGQIKQVFVLTHNIYFHKEVSFDPKRSGSDRRGHETFWTVRKVDNLSRVQEHLTNPVKTSYELLWAEVKNPDRSTLTIQNVLRRILEHYFTILGSMDKNDVIAKFEGRDALICASLFSWVNDGSHNFADDLYVAADAATVERYLAVFKSIFERTGHGAHYRMMFGPEPDALSEVVTDTDHTPADMTAPSSEFVMETINAAVKVTEEGLAATAREPLNQ